MPKEPIDNEKEEIVDNLSSQNNTILKENKKNDLEKRMSIYESKKVTLVQK